MKKIMMMKKISRAEAKKKGLKFYFTGKPCVHGHISERYLFGGCVECMKMHKSKEEYKEQSREYSRQYRKENKEDIRKKYKIYYESNREYHLQRRKDHRQENVEKERLYRKKEKKEKSSYYAALQAKRRATKINATPSWFGDLDEFVIEQALELAKERSNVFGFDWQVDHMVPLQCESACGIHYHKNIQVIPRYINASKNNKLVMIEPLEWMKND